MRNAIQDKQKAASAWRPHDNLSKIVPATFQEVRHQRRAGLDELLMARKTPFARVDVKGASFAEDRRLRIQFSNSHGDLLPRPKRRLSFSFCPWKRGAWRAERRSLHYLASRMRLAKATYEKRIAFRRTIAGLLAKGPPFRVRDPKAFWLKA